MQKGLAIVEKSLMNLRYNLVWRKMLLNPFTKIGRGKFSITSNFYLYVSIPFCWGFMDHPIPSFTMKFYFSQLSIKFNFSHHCNTRLILFKQLLNKYPSTKKLSFNTSKVSSSISEKIDIIHHWYIDGALHIPIDILLKENVP